MNKDEIAFMLVLIFLAIVFVIVLKIHIP